MALLEFTNRGIYCPPAGYYIDPWGRVDNALITHAHGDHSRWGMKHYLAHAHSEGVMRLRLGADISLETVQYGETIYKNGVQVSFHPAGHIYGSSQIRLEHRGEIWVVSGDYKTEDDKLSPAFEPLRCHAFITESTFGLPIYQWRPQTELFAEINQWWRSNAAAGKVSVIFGYSLGKAQRILTHLDTEIGRIFVHGAVYNTNRALESSGAVLPPYTRVSQELDKIAYRGGIVVAPPSAVGTPWLRKFQPYTTAVASGWMSLRGAKRRKAVDRGFVLSDHADWNGLIGAVAATGAQKVFVTHGYKSAFVRYLNEQGTEAYELDTLYEGEALEGTPLEEEKTEETPLPPLKA